MTEAEWLKCEDPRVLLEYLETLPVSDRKYTLTACATRRQSKRFDDSWEDWNFWSKMENDGMNCLPSGSHIPRVFLYSEYKDYFLTAIRDVIGNPFRPLANSNEYGFDPAVMDRLVGAAKALGRKNATEWILPARVLTDEVRSLALAAYEERAERGQLDPFRLNLLADAMEEAGCPEKVSTLFKVDIIIDGEGGCWTLNAFSSHLPDSPVTQYADEFESLFYWAKTELDMKETSYRKEDGASGAGWLPQEVDFPFLSHLRSPGPHYRGCHVLDAVLGYS